MSWVITTFNNKSPRHVVNKNLSVVEVTNCDNYSDINLKRPMVILAGIQSKNANYAYIPEFGRYYFVTDKTITNDGRLILELDSDPLSSFWGDIAKSPCVANRSSSNYDPYIHDDLITIRDKTNYSVRALSGSFAPTTAGSNHYVITIGGLNP